MDEDRVVMGAERKYRISGITSSERKSTTVHTMYAHRPKPSTPIKEAMENFEGSDLTIVLGSNASATEIETAANITIQLTLLNHYVRSFEAAVQLYEVSAEQTAAAREALNANKDQAEVVLEIMDGWPLIAARDGAMSIYNFGKVLSAMDESIAGLQILKEHIPTDLRRDARRLFSEAFPDFIYVRHGIAHSGERLKSNVAGKHSSLESWSNGHISYEQSEDAPISFILTDVLSQRRYSNTWDGKVRSYEISLASLKKLAAARDKIFEAVIKGSSEFIAKPKNSEPL